MKLQDLPKGTPISLDTETSGLATDDGGRISVVSFAFRDPETNQVVAQAIPFDQGMNDLPLGPKDLAASHKKRLAKWPEWAQAEVVPNRHPDELVRFWDVLERIEAQLIYHHMKFDGLMAAAGLRGLPHTGRDLEPLFSWDTQLAQHVREPQMPTALKHSAVRLMLTESGDEDAEQEALTPWLGPRTGKNSDPRYDLVPWQVMEPYATKDAILTLLLFEYQQERLDPDEEAQALKHIYREFNLARTLYRMELRGIGFDADECLRSAAILKAEMERIGQLLPFKGGTGKPTPPAARKYFFADAGRPPYKGLTTESGQPQVNEEVIARLVKDGVEWAKEYEDHEGLKSALSKWYEAWPAKIGTDGRLRTTHRQGRVVSGRLAVERVQLQAIPHDYLIPMLDQGVTSVRKMFRPKPGHVLQEFDVSQAEIRIATAMAKCTPMLAGILRGEDSHGIATRLMFDIDESDSKWEFFRQVAKRCNLGILYGAGVMAIMEQITKFTGYAPTRSEVGGWINNWRDAFPQFADALRESAKVAESVGYVRLYNGRERWFSDYEPSHKAFNQKVQGSLAEVMKDLMPEVDRLYPDELLLQVHDSIILETPIEQAEARAKQICDLMARRFEEAFEDQWEPGGPVVRVPFVSDTKRFGQEPGRTEAPPGKGLALNLSTSDKCYAGDGC